MKEENLKEVIEFLGVIILCCICVWKGNGFLAFFLSLLAFSFIL